MLPGTTSLSAQAAAASRVPACLTPAVTHQRVRHANKRAPFSGFSSQQQHQACRAPPVRVAELRSEAERFVDELVTEEVVFSDVSSEDQAAKLQDQLEGLQRQVGTFILSICA